MFSLLSASTNSGNGTLTLVATVIISVLVALGAGFRTFTVLKNKKINTSSLEGLVNSICGDDCIADILKSIFTAESYEKCNTYDEFIQYVHTTLESKLYDYLKNNTCYIPDALLKLVTLENIGYIADAILSMAGYDGAKLTKMFEDHVIDSITNGTTEDIDIPEDELKENVEPAVEKESDPVVEKDTEEVKSEDTTNTEAMDIIAEEVEQETITDDTDTEEMKSDVIDYSDYQVETNESVKDTQE